MPTMSDLNQGKILAIAGNQSAAIDVMRALRAAGYRLDYLIAVGPEQAHHIADYQDFGPIAEAEGIPLLRPPTYHMKDDATRALFVDKPIDLLISVGWQRLIPEWLLERLSIGAFGMHGSSQPLPRGRGRSPMVWSILEERDRFLTNLFRYDAGVDSGQIVGTQRFDIYPWDSIRSLQHKNALAQIQLLLEHLPALLAGTAVLTPQPNDVEATFYPKRTPDDGVIDWHDAAARIDRLVRGVSPPYPGAFTFLDGQRVNVWAGQLFDRHLRFEDAAPGQIVAAFHDDTFVVQCGHDTYYVTSWEGPEGWRPRAGMVFESRANKSWEMLAAMGAEETPA